MLLNAVCQCVPPSNVLRWPISSFRLNKTRLRVLLFLLLAIRTLYILGHRICLDKTQTHHRPHRERTRDQHQIGSPPPPHRALFFSFEIDPTFSVVIVLIASEAEQNPPCNSPMGMLSPEVDIIPSPLWLDKQRISRVISWKKWTLISSTSSD